MTAPNYPSLDSLPPAIPYESKETEIPEPVEAPSTDQQEVPQESLAPIEDRQEKNWKEVRSQLKQLKAEKEALAREMEKLKKPVATEEDFDIKPDDLVDAKTAKRMAEKLVEQKLAHLQAQQQAELAEIRLKAKFPDIEKVVTPEALERLQEDEPELYATIVAQHDIYAKGAAAYKLIKTMSKAKEDPYAKERAKAESNMKKPVPSQSVKGGGNSQESIFLNGLTPELKKQLWKEMEEARKRS